MNLAVLAGDPQRARQKYGARVLETQNAAKLLYYSMILLCGYQVIALDARRSLQQLYQGRSPS